MEERRKIIMPTVDRIHHHNKPARAQSLPSQGDCSLNSPVSGSKNSYFPPRGSVSQVKQRHLTRETGKASFQFKPSFRSTNSSFRGDISSSNMSLSRNSTARSCQNVNDGDNGADSNDFLEDTTPKSIYYRSLRSKSGDRIHSNSVHERNSRYGTIRSLGHEFVGDKCRKGLEKPAVFKPSGVMVKCVVITLDGNDMQLELDKESLGQQLFDRVCEEMDLCPEERMFFGIIRRDKIRTWYWLQMEKKISKQVKREKWHFEVQVKFYPYEVDSLIESLTRYYLCLQVRQNILNGSLRCTFPTYVILGAYVVQSEAGDYNPSRHVGIEYVKNQLFAPKEKQTPEMLDKIVELHKQLRGLCVEEADLMFLNNVKKLALYGVDFHKVSTDHHTSGDMQLGIYYGGILLYKNFLRLKRISWARLIKVSYQQKEFFMVVRAADEHQCERELRFKCDSKQMSKRLYTACVEHHRFFRLREQHLARRPQILPSSTRTYIRSLPSSFGSPNESQVDESVVAAVPLRAGRPQPLIKRAPTNIIPPLPAPNKSPSVNPTLSAHNGSTRESQILRKPRPVFQPLYWRLHLPDSTRGLGLHEIGLDAASRTGGGWQGIRTNQGVKESGRYYFEAKVLEEGPIMIGWSTNDANLEPVGSDSLGWALGLLPGEGKQKRWCTLFHSNKNVPLFRNQGSSQQQVLLQVDDIVGCFISYPPTASGQRITLQWTVNGEPVLPFGRPLALPQELYGSPLFPSISMFDSRLEINLGDTPFTFSPANSTAQDDFLTYLPLNEAAKECLVPNANAGWCMNPFDATQMLVVSPDMKQIQSTEGTEWQGCRANKGVLGGGKYYYEVTPLENGLHSWSRVGWSTDKANLNLGSDEWGYGYGADKDGFGINGQQGKRLHCDEINNYGEAYTEGDVIGCFLDLTIGSIRWSKNGKEFGEGFQIPGDKLKGCSFFPSASVKENTLLFNFGETPFKFPPKDRTFMHLAYAPSGNVVHSRCKDPKTMNSGYSDRLSITSTIREAKELSLSNYRNGHNGDQSISSTLHKRSPQTPQRQQTIEVIHERNSNIPNPVRNSKTFSGGHFTSVETPDSQVDTQYYYNADGNYVKRTTTKTTRRITTTNTIITAKSENQINSQDSTKKFESKAHEQEINAAIISVTGMIPHDSFVVTQSRNSTLESDI